MRYVRVPTENTDRDVDFDLVQTVQYVFDDGRRKIRLTYRTGSTVDVALGAGPDLYEKVKDTAGCEFPCFYRREADSAPTDPACRDCQLLEILVPHGFDPRPVRIGRGAGERNGWQVAAIALLCLVAVLLGLLAQAGQNGHEEKEKHVISNGF